MRNYIAIELKKMNVKNHLWGLLIANIFILILSIALGTLIPLSMEMMEGMNFSIETVVLVDTLIKAIFIVWEAILLALVVVSEFQNNTALMLYTYPVSMKKIVLAKVEIILFIITGFILVSEIIQNIGLWIAGFIIPSLTYHFSLNLLITILVTTIGSVLMGLIPLYFGIISKSVITTITTAIFILCIVTSSAAGPGGILSKMTASMVLGLLGILTMKATLNKIDKEEFKITKK